MASESSFDIVNKVDRQEVDNAVNQAAKEINQRFDFKNVDAGIKWSGETIDIQANTEERANAVLDVFKDKLIKRHISLKSLEADEPKLSGKLYKINASLECRHHPGEREEAVQADPRRGPEGRQGADPGRRAPGVQQEPGRPAVGAEADQGAGVRLRRPVRELPLTPRHPPRMVRGGAPSSRRQVLLKACRSG